MKNNIKQIQIDHQKAVAQTQVKRQAIALQINLFISIHTPESFVDTLNEAKSPLAKALELDLPNMERNMKYTTRRIDVRNGRNADVLEQLPSWLERVKAHDAQEPPLAPPNSPLFTSRRMVVLPPPLQRVDTDKELPLGSTDNNHILVKQSGCGCVIM